MPDPASSTSLTAAAPVLEAVDLRRQADDGTLLLDGVSLTLSAGDRVAMQGPSGAGKSVLLRALVLLDPIAGGRVAWHGAPPAAEAMPRFRRRAVYLAQDPVIEEGTVLDQLALPWRFASAADATLDRAAALEMLDRAGRDERFLRQRGENLSGGEAQLVALVRALLLAPQVLLLDEPTAAMDAVTREGAEALLDRWHAADPARAWIWVSHDPRQLERTCSRSLRIAAGRMAR